MYGTNLRNTVNRLENELANITNMSNFNNGNYSV